MRRLITAILFDVARNRIVRYKGRWGVVCSRDARKSAVVVDFWDGGYEYVPDWHVVEVEA